MATEVLHYEESIQKDGIKTILAESICHQMSRICSKPLVKKCMLEMIMSNIVQVIKITRNLLEQDKYFIKKLPNTVFEWSLLHFQDRMRPDIEYIDVLRLEEPQSVFITKFLTDLYNLELCLQLIQNNDSEAAISHLKGCDRLLKIREEVTLNAVYSKKVIRDLERRVANFDKEEAEEMGAMTEKVNETIDHCLDEILVKDPLQKRYRRNTHLNEDEMTEHALIEQENDLEKSIQKYKDMTNRSNATLNNVINHHKIVIEEYKSKIGYWSWNYDIEYEKIYNEITNTELKLQALNHQWKDCEDRIIFYKKEIENVQRKNTALPEKGASKKKLHVGEKIKKR